MIWLVVPAIQEVRFETEERTLLPLVWTNLDADNTSLVILPVTLNPLVMAKLPENEDDPVPEKVLAPYVKKFPETEATPPNEAVPRVSKSPLINKSLLAEM